MTSTAVDRSTIRRIYDRWGDLYRLADVFEKPAKTLALARLQIDPASRVLELGPGPGRELAIVRASTPDGLTVGVDLSPVMARAARERAGAPVVVGRSPGLPFRDATFDRALSCYVFDLISDDLRGPILDDIYRVVSPGGRLGIVTVTNGFTRGNRLVMAGWKAVYRVSPALCGGCRPVDVGEAVADAGFVDIEQTRLSRVGVASQITMARRPA